MRNIMVNNPWSSILDLWLEFIAATMTAITVLTKSKQLMYLINATSDFMGLWEFKPLWRSKIFVSDPLKPLKI